MTARLEPIAEGIQTVPVDRKRVDTYAIVGRAEMMAIARAMPDAQSAILFCLAWQAAFQVKMSRGPLARRRVARVSVSALAKMIRRPIRTVQYALSKLRAIGVIEQEDVGPGRTSVYKLNLLNEPGVVVLAEASRASQGQEGSTP
jgi:hypothetical protein